MENDSVGSDAYLGDNGAFADDWTDNLPEDTFEKDDTGALKMGDVKDHKEIGSLVKSYMNSQKKLGTAIQPLKEDATDEERRAHFTKQGCPEKADGYEITPPELPEGMEFDSDLLGVVKAYAHANGTPKTVFEGMAKVLMEGQVKKYNELMAAAKVAQDKAAEEANNKLKGKWGADHDKFVEMARRSYDVHGGKEFVDLMESTGLKDNAIVVETFLKIFQLTNPKEFVAEGTPPGKTVEKGQLDYSTVHGHSGRQEG